MPTALELVNRVRAKRRDGTSAVITDRNGVAYLEVVNSAITTVLESRVWDFQIRHDGVVVTVRKIAGGSLILDGAGVQFISTTYGGGIINEVVGDFTLRIEFPGDSVYGNSSSQIETGLNSGTNLVGFLREPFPGTQTQSSYNTYAYEYKLPDTVRQVLEVRHEEQDNTLVFSDSPTEFDDEFPRPQDDFSNQPQIVVVGGETFNTANFGVTPEYGLAMRVWPVPDTEYRLNYSFVRRHARLTVATDELDRVPPAVVDLIVDLSVARAIAEIEKDPTIGFQLENKIIRDMERLHRNHVPSAGRRPGMQSHDNPRTRPGNLYRLPRSVAGLTGS